MANRGKYIIGIRLLLEKEYLQANAGKDRCVGRRELEEYLAERGYPVEKKTIYTDLAILESEFGMQLEYDPHRKGYRLLNPPFEPYELRLMVDSIQSTKFITTEKAREITGKIKAFAGKDTVESLNREAYVADRVRNMNDSVVKDSDRIHRAIRQDRKIRFRYFHYTPDGKKSYSQKGTPYTVSPFALYWNKGNYYLYAHDGKKFRYYRIDRMDRISLPLEEPREHKDEYKESHITKPKAKVFDMYSGPEQTVKLRFINRLADAVMDEFGRDVMMFPLDDKHFTITVPVEISPPFFAWLATLGHQAKILYPEAVRKQMRKFLNDSMDMVKEDGEK